MPSFPFPAPPSIFHPAPQLTRLQLTRPVCEVRLPDGNTAWLVTRFDDVRRVLVDPRFSRAEAAKPGVADTGLGQASAGTILGLDPPEHTRVRRLVAGAFTGRRVEALRPRVTELVDTLIDRMETLPRPVDLVENFSRPLPVEVICELLGVPATDRHLFHEWSGVAAAHAGQERLWPYFVELIERKRKEPADDLMTALIAARDNEDRLTEDELVRMGLTLLEAGHETTANQISLFLLTLHEYPGQLARLRAKPEIIPEAVEELLRFVQLGEIGTGLPRVATTAVELGGVTIPAGAAVIPATTIANRDPSVIPDANQLDLTRPQGAHLAFGAGVHHCLGAQLARMELQEALSGLLRRLPSLRPDAPVEELTFEQGMFMRSLHALPVRW